MKFDTDNGRMLKRSTLPGCTSLRRKVRVHEKGLEHFTFRIATGVEDLQAAYRTVYDVYLKKGYIDASPSGRRCTSFDLLPTTVTFIATTGSECSATVTLYPDSIQGIPMDSIYGGEVDRLRDQGRLIAEVGAFASRHEQQNVMLHLIKALQHYAIHILGADDLVICVNPRHQFFYRCALLFEPLGGLRTYPRVRNNPAVALRADLLTIRESYRKVYGGQPEEHDLHHFFFEKQSSCIVLPTVSLGSRKEKNRTCAENAPSR